MLSGNSFSCWALDSVHIEMFANDTISHSTYSSFTSNEWMNEEWSAFTPWPQIYNYNVNQFIQPACYCEGAVCDAMVSPYYPTHSLEKFVCQFCTAMMKNWAGPAMTHDTSWGFQCNMLTGHTPKIVYKSFEGHRAYLAFIFLTVV